MTDTFSSAKRSEIMGRIGQKNTQPEIIVRRLLHRLGYRFRLHRRDLPGTPDIVLPRHRKIVFVHGCFWHSHAGCSRSSLPDTNREFWERKIGKNSERDRIALAELKTLGWDCMVVWQCEVRDRTALEDRIRRFLTDR